MPDEKIDEKQDAQKAEPEAEAKDGREAAPQDGADETAGGGEVADKHGQPGINREKYARDMKARDDKIAELQAQLDEKAKTEEGRASLKKELDDLKAEMAGSASPTSWRWRDAATSRPPRRCSTTTTATWTSSRRGAPTSSRGRRRAPRGSS